MKVSMESPEVKSGNAGQPRATREIPPLYIFSQAGTCPGVPGKDERQLLRGVAHPRHAIRTRPAFIRTRGGCSYPDSAPLGAPPSVRTGPAHIRTRGGCSYRGFVPVGAPHSVRTGPAHFRTRRACSYRGFILVGAPPSVRTGQAHIRTRGGCSYSAPRIRCIPPAMTPHMQPTTNPPTWAALAIAPKPNTLMIP